MRIVSVGFTLVIIGLATTPALADEQPNAADLKHDGDVAMSSLHYREALVAYDKAYAISHDPAILYNRARADQALGDYPAALDAIEEFVRTAPDDLKRRVPKLADLVADVRSHVAFVVVTCPVDGADVFVDGKVVGKTPLSAPIRVPTGSLAIAVEARGHVTFRQDITVQGGKVTNVNAALASEGTDTHTEPPPPPPPPERTERYVPAGWRVAAFTMGGFGIAGLAAGSVFGGLVASKTSDAAPHCPMKACDATGWNAISDAKTFATISTVSFIAGGVLVAGAAVLFIVAPHATRKIAIAPIIGPTFLGIGGVL
jgi:hypothetical protein